MGRVHGVFGIGIAKGAQKKRVASLRGATREYFAVMYWQFRRQEQRRGPTVLCLAYIE
jgi:hypothetical protein